MQRSQDERQGKRERWVADEEKWLAPFMLTHEYLLQEKWGHHLLHPSRNAQPWTEAEERNWMQHIVRTLPVNSYLHRIGKHATGECEWCAGKRETITHFQTECGEFVSARHAAHNLVWQTLLAGMEKHAVPGWRFFQETSFDNLPFDFEWKDVQELAEEEDRQPDGVAYHEASRTVFLLEFTRAMDHSHTMGDAIARKGHQYDKALSAFRRHQRNTVWSKRVTIKTLPFVFGVRGSVMEQECAKNMRAVGVLNRDEVTRILTQGVRAAIRALQDMKLARSAALAELRLEQDARSAAKKSTAKTTTAPTATGKKRKKAAKTK